MFLLFAVTHWGACAWYLVGVTEHSGGPTWITAHIGPDLHIMDRYIYSLYFTLTTMTTVGYGDIAAQNLREVAFVLVLLVVASVVFAGLLGALSDIISNYNTEANALAIKRHTLARYMMWRHLPKDLSVSLRDHLLFLWAANAGFDAYEEDIKSLLPPMLRRELCHSIYGKVLAWAPFLSWMHSYDPCMKDLANVLETTFLSSGDYLFHVGHTNDQVHIVRQGTVRLSLNERLFSDPLPGSHQHDGSEDLEKMLRFMKLSGLPNQSHAADDDPFACFVSGHDATGSAGGYKSKILADAKRKLEIRDMKEKVAALGIQRRWRRKRSMRATLRPRASHRCNTAILERVKTKSIHAPAYFGEACLWVPLDKWSEQPPTYKYSVMCESRVEVLILQRSQLREVIDTYSPWLRERFETFQESVVNALKQAAKTDEQRNLAAQSFSREGDYEIPSDGSSAIPCVNRVFIYPTMTHASIFFHPTATPGSRTAERTWSQTFSFSRFRNLGPSARVARMQEPLIPPGQGVRL